MIGTASSRNHDAGRALGADAVIDYRTEDVPGRVRELTDGRGVDAIVESVDSAAELLPALGLRRRPGGDRRPPRLDRRAAVHHRPIGS